MSDGVMADRIEVRAVAADPPADSANSAADAAPLSSGFAGHARARFAEVIREHQAMVFSIAWHFLHNRAIAEEIAQEVFLELYRRLDTIESPTHLMRWLRRVTSHRCLDYVRSAKVTISLQDAPVLSYTPKPGDPARDQTLRSMIATLPEVQRLAVVLRYQEDLGPAEIAEVLDLPVNTVKSQLHRGLRLLRQKLSRMGATS